MTNYSCYYSFFFICLNSQYLKCEFHSRTHQFICILANAVQLPLRFLLTILFKCCMECSKNRAGKRQIFHVGASEQSDIKLAGQTKITVCDAFTMLIYDMLTVLEFFLLFFFFFPSGRLWYCGVGLTCFRFRNRELDIWCHLIYIISD